jgi:hypothetical protein
VSVLRGEFSGWIALKGLKQVSPGRRPGERKAKGSPALKGRHKGRPSPRLRRGKLFTAVVETPPDRGSRSQRRKVATFGNFLGLSSSPISKAQTDFGPAGDARGRTLHRGSLLRWHKAVTLATFWGMVQEEATVQPTRTVLSS